MLCLLQEDATKVVLLAQENHSLEEKDKVIAELSERLLHLEVGKASFMCGYIYRLGCSFTPGRSKRSQVEKSAAVPYC